MFEQSFDRPWMISKSFVQMNEMNKSRTRQPLVIYMPKNNCVNLHYFILFCFVFNLKNYNLSIFYSGISLMDVAHGPSFIYEPPARVLISSGSGGTVPCAAHGIPPPSLSWLDSMEQPVSVIKGIKFFFNINRILKSTTGTSHS